MIIGCFILPHGTETLDPTQFDTTSETSKQWLWKLYNACHETGKNVASLNPDLVLLSTPHGIADLKNFVIYLNPKVSGYADYETNQTTMSVDIDVEMSEEIIQTLGVNRNVTGISAFGPPGKSLESIPLRWGEVIPLHFIPNATNLKTVILSQPSRRYSEAAKMIPELLDLGSSLYTILEKSEKKIVVIVSGDLSHTHDADGPYGYSNTSEPFDEACGRWASTLQPDHLLVTAAALQDGALSCGFTGFVTLHGILQAAGLHNWNSELLVNHHPTYYGMMVASFLPKTVPSARPEKINSIL